MFGDVASDRFGVWPGVPFKGTDGGVPRTGEQDRGVGPVLGGVCQGRVP
jgi:hypothetical protein